MKKRIRVIILALTGAFLFGRGPVLPQGTEIAAVAYAEEGGEDSGGEDRESETEHPASYYDEIQTNSIEGWPEGAAIDSDAAILMDAGTGTILYGKNIEKQEYPASITKIMTVLLALEKGNLDDVVTFSENAVYSIEFGSAHLGLTEGEELTLEQCLYGIMLASANEISNAVAEHIGGSVEGFVQMMNDKAAELGCTNTHFVNPNGLHDENHYVCARDMALITREALKYDKFREIMGTVEYYYPETNLVDEKRYFMNHHAMISDEDMLYVGCLGGKTGYTDQAWNTLVTAAERDGMTLISVVLHTPGIDSEYGNTRTLLDYGFDCFKEAQVQNHEQGKQLEITGIENQDEIAKIQSADLTQKPFAMGETAMITVPQNADLSSLVRKMDFTTGKLAYYYGGQEVGSTAFTYTGDWEPETEVPTESETETETETESPASGILGKLTQNKLSGSVAGLYGEMDAFIKENTVMASVLGAVLLVIFVPLLLVTVNRSRKYKKMMELRMQEMELRRRLEAEIEEKTAAQVEAELRAQELEIQLEEERKRGREDAEAGKESEDQDASKNGLED